MSLRHRFGLMATLALFLSGDALRAWSPGTGDPTAVQDFTVDTTNRSDVLSFYNTVYSASQNYASDMAWTGNVANDVPGTTSATFKDDVERRVNFYRALAGLPGDITFDDGESSEDQQAALMFSVNNAISHTPPPTWIDYTLIGATAAANSDIAIGTYGPGSIDGYMTDPGSTNTEVGHRRWILYSQAAVMGTGDIPPTGNGVYDGSGNNYSAANALWILDNFKAAPTPQFVSWPNSGYCPFPLMPARWSLSYPGADFTAATVTMTQGGTPIPCTIISSDSNATNLVNGMIGDNTLVWEPTGLPASINADTPFTVTVSGIGGGGPTSTTYTTTLFDPNVLGQSATITGSGTPPVAGASYTFTSINEADAYDLQVSTGSTAAWDEGAEASPAPQVIASTTGTYTLIHSSQNDLQGFPPAEHSGTNSFQLTFPGNVDGNGALETYDFDDQSFQITRQIIPTASSQLQFYDMCRFATTTTTLSAQVSTDNGITWTSVWSRFGVGGTSSASWDPAFIQNDVSVASYTGQVILVRFVLSGNGASVDLGADASVGFFLDDITVTHATQLINSTITPLTGSATSFTLNSATAGSALQAGASYYLQIQPEVGLKWYGYGAYDLVTVQAAPITGYSSWITTLYPAVTGGPSGDYSGDGITNGYKYAFGLDPTVRNPLAAIPAPVISTSSMTLSYTAPVGVVGVTYGAESSTDLVTWTAITDTGTGNTHTFTVSTVGHPRMFIRHDLLFAP